MKKQKRPNTKSVFNKYLARTLVGNNSDETIAIFSALDYNHFYNIAKRHKLKERQISSLVGFKDEFFVLTLICQIIKELRFEDVYDIKKVTANRGSGLLARRILYDGKEVSITLGGDCVIFRKLDNKPLMIIECKEYIDMIRLKELIGESRLIKDEITGSTNLLSGVSFCIFAEVLELTKEWNLLLKHSDLRYRIDEIFIIRDGKRKDKNNKPVRTTLEEFKNFIIHFLLNAQ